MPDKSITVPFQSNEKIMIEVKSLSARTLLSNSAEWKAASLTTDSSQLDRQDKLFQLETAIHYTTLSSNNFRRFAAMLSNDENMKAKIAAVCSAMGLGDFVLNSTHACERFMYWDRLSLTNAAIEGVLANNLNMGFKIGHRDFEMGYLFLISNRVEKLEYDVVNNTLALQSLTLEFAIRPSTDNVMGMNALHKKILFVDYYGGTVTIAECWKGESECPTINSVYYGVSYRAFKIALDILTFIFFVSLIFAGVVSYDKFANEEEYVKE